MVDPGGPKTCGSGFGFLYLCLFHCPVCRNINIKGKYGFIELDEAEDAEDAVKELDGKSFNGGRYAVPGTRVPDPNRIRIQLGQWIRIRIWNPDPNPGMQILPTKVEKKQRNFMF